MSAKMPFYRLVAARHGRFFVNPNDLYIGQSLRLYGEWSEAEIRLFDQMVLPGDTVLEAGANIGSHTLWFSQRVGSAGTVYAFEPARHTFQLLCANLVANDCLNVRAVQQAVGSVPGRVEFPLPDPGQPFNFGGASAKKPWAGATETVALTSIDALALDRLDLLKADVEGFEVEVLEGATQTLARCRPAVYVEINTQEVRNAVVALLEPQGYVCWYYITPMFWASNWLGRSDDIFNDYSFDMLCLPEERFEVSSMSRAGVDDGVMRYLPTQRVWATHPWDQARVSRRAC
ncbi:FkbM family methyltransferase [Xenophilus azovorans]|uniref:FkbM family methyltransferase n=1 Tax=Xenophilus TaxID=151754 RepID=UPI00068DCDE1|nr:FkbM family methyltransferase [Xenophilus azovorans]